MQLDGICKDNDFTKIPCVMCSPGMPTISEKDKVVSWRSMQNLLVSFAP